LNEIWHGTPGGYTNHRCKCVDCRTAWATYRRVRRIKEALPPTCSRCGEWPCVVGTDGRLSSCLSCYFRVVYRGASPTPSDEGDTRGPQMTAAMVRLARMADVLFVRCPDESNDPDPDYGF
jgi:hypothetical protein